MDLLASCQCGAQFRADRKRVGAVVKCPKCGASIQLELDTYAETVATTHAAETVGNRADGPPDLPPPLPSADAPKISEGSAASVPSLSPRRGHQRASIRPLLVNSLITLFCIVGLAIVAVLIYASVRQSQDAARAPKHNQERGGRTGDSSEISSSNPRPEAKSLTQNDPDEARASSEGNRTNSSSLQSAERNREMKIGIDDSAGPEILGVKMRNSSGPLIGSVDVGTFLDCIQFSPDGTLLAAGVRGGNEDDIKIVDIRTGGVVKTLAGLGSQVIAFSPDGLTLAAGGRPKIVVLWDLNSGKPKRILRGHRGSIISLAFDVNGEKLASSAGDGLVKVWNALSGEELKSIEIENNWRPSPVATFHPKTNALIWTDGKNVKFQREDGSTGTLDVGVRGPLIRISADAKYLALGAGVGGSQIKIWELSSETYVRNCGETFQSEYILDFHPDGRLLASASTSGFKLWDVSSGKAIYWNDLGQVESVDFAPNGTVLATGGVYAEISFWDMSTILQSHRAQELAENCNESKRDRLELQGIWSGKEGNDPVAYEFNKSKVRFGGLGEIVGDQVDFWFSYSLDARATPKRIDIFREFDGVRHFMLRGVYRFEDAKLRIDYGRTAQSALPTTVHVGRGNTTVELQRFSTIEQ